ncbi:MAG: DUF6383 domain-containing protein [Tannerella sp.]|nr:DUF6383 domain-containing protein [Tannerella sp.]
MNKKIFTLLMGVVLAIGSAFTASAQWLGATPTVYGNKAGNAVAFHDTLRADSVKFFAPTTDGRVDKYVLSVTGIANATPDVAAAFPLLDINNPAYRTVPSRQLSYALFVDAGGYLRMETVANLDNNTGQYDFNKLEDSEYSDKFEAMQRMLWCGTVRDLGASGGGGIAGSNVVFNFTNMKTKLALQSPSPASGDDKWNMDGFEPALDGNNRHIYVNSSPNDGLGINLAETDLNNWHFSQTFLSSQPLQQNMPFYTYYTRDSVMVLTIDDKTNGGTPNVRPIGSGLGGHVITVKAVAIRDLVTNDAAANIRTTGAKIVSNVLIITLKKLEPFVLNAADYNTVADRITFDPDANTAPHSLTNPANDRGGWNPFVANDLPDHHGHGTLTAVEVYDSLYRYGYLQLYRGSDDDPEEENWLQVDTNFWNLGNDEFVSFNWSIMRDTLNGRKWGTYKDENATKPVYTNTKWPAANANVYWRVDSLIWAIAKYLDNKYTFSGGLISGGGGIFPTLATTGVNETLDQILGRTDAYLLWNEIFSEAASLGYSLSFTPKVFINPGPQAFTPTSTTNITIMHILEWTYGTPPVLGTLANSTDYVTANGGFNYKPILDEIAIFNKDSLKWLLDYNTDSLMENQSKFRVVYNPNVDSVWINVYQSRVRNTNYDDPQNPTVGPWWENSFILAESNWLPGQIFRPSDFYYFIGQDNSLFWSNYRVEPTSSTTYYYGPGLVSFWAGLTPPTTTFYGGIRPISTASRVANATTDFGAGWSQFHSFMMYYPRALYTNSDKVMISTADTSVFFRGGNPLSWIYGSGRNTDPSRSYYYQDSLLYVDMQDLQGNEWITTLHQSSRGGGVKQLSSHIRLFDADCTPKDVTPVDAFIPSDLYLIRNAKGQFLAVPIWSITDSAYWITPEPGEDPTQIPSYQWAVENVRDLRFTLTNREFEKVQYEQVRVPLGGSNNDQLYPTSIDLTVRDKGARWADLANQNILSAAVHAPIGFQNSGTGVTVPGPNNFLKFMDGVPIMGGGASWFRLNDDVKGEQLLGYTYMHPDTTIVDVYAFKYYNRLAQVIGQPQYIGWNGYDNVPDRDTVVYVNKTEYADKAFFQLFEMDDTTMVGGPNGDDIVFANGEDNIPEGYEDLFAKYYHNQTSYLNGGMLFEGFGYPEHNDVTPIENIKPLARQAYRLLLKDYFKFAPTVIQGDYMTVGQQDKYIIADKVYATRPYVPNSGKVEGLFGVPYFYFRNTYFGIKNNYENGVTRDPETYFALVQRLDTVSDPGNYAGWTKWDAVLEYAKMQWGTVAAAKIRDQVEYSHELGLFVSVVDDGYGELKLAVRGDAAIRVSTFTLEQDNDPLYRRFHWNDKFEWKGDMDEPLNLEFHRLNNNAEKFYENTGADKRTGGGWVYNLIDPNAAVKTLKRDSIGNIISFLGFKNSIDFEAETNPDGYPTSFEADGSPTYTNYSFYVDTAYIRRGTGWIKPQYMLAVDTMSGYQIAVEDCHCTPEPDFEPYMLGRYMYNTSMYAKEVDNDYRYEKSDPISDLDFSDHIAVADFNKDGKIDGKDNRYAENKYDLTLPVREDIWHGTWRTPHADPMDGKAYTLNNTKWERFSFAWAIHKGDTLYVLKTNIDKDRANYKTDARTLVDALIKDYGLVNGSLKWDELRATNGWTLDKLKQAGKQVGLHAMVFLGNNYHKDWVFSFRYFERGSDDFIIESETTNRDWIHGPTIRPGWGGWLKWQNGVPVISRSDEKELMGEGEYINVRHATVAPVANENVSATSSVTVVGGAGNVTILNASGKKVVISNLLGQTVANTVLSSDRATIAVPSGVVIVAVQGESAVKAIVK